MPRRPTFMMNATLLAPGLPVPAPTGATPWLLRVAGPWLLGLWVAMVLLVAFSTLVQLATPRAGDPGLAVRWGSRCTLAALGWQWAAVVAWWTLTGEVDPAHHHPSPHPASALGSGRVVPLRVVSTLARVAPDVLPQALFGALAAVEVWTWLWWGHRRRPLWTLGCVTTCLRVGTGDWGPADVLYVWPLLAAGVGLA